MRLPGILTSQIVVTSRVGYEFRERRLPRAQVLDWADDRVQGSGGDYFVAAGSGLTDRLRARLTQESGKWVGPDFSAIQVMEELPNHGDTVLVPCVRIVRILVQERADFGKPDNKR